MAITFFGFIKVDYKATKGLNVNNFIQNGIEI